MPSSSQSEGIGFRPVRISDLPTLTAWLKEPHVQRFYQKTRTSLDEVAAEYGPLIRRETPDTCHLAASDDVPFAYLQSYRNVDYRDWAVIIGVNDGISVDLFIGEPAYLRRGFGRLILGDSLQRIAFPNFAAEKRAYIAHESANTAALRCSQAVGFRPFREFTEDGVKMLLLTIERSIVR
jgi:aminoglycoside 6'-N-acetyltransferase